MKSGDVEGLGERELRQGQGCAEQWLAPTKWMSDEEFPESVEESSRADANSGHLGLKEWCGQLLIKASMVICRVSTLMWHLVRN